LGEHTIRSASTTS